VHWLAAVKHELTVRAKPSTQRHVGIERLAVLLKVRDANVVGAEYHPLVQSLVPSRSTRKSVDFPQPLRPEKTNPVAGPELEPQIAKERLNTWPRCVW
jgi:hypothetical protein